MLSLSQRQSLLQRFTPQQIQYLKMLQLPVLALEQRIKEEMEQNPLLEEAGELSQDQDDAEPVLGARDEAGDAGGDTADGTADGAAEAEAPAEDREADFDWDEFTAGEYEGYKAPTFTGSENEEYEEIPQRAEESPTELLLAQLRMQNLTEDEMALAEEIIGNIDDHGYLLRPLRDIVDDLNKFIAATRLAPANDGSPLVLGDGHFDTYESAAEEPFGRERLRATHPYRPRDTAAAEGHEEGPPDGHHSPDDDLDDIEHVRAEHADNRAAGSGMTDDHHAGSALSQTQQGNGHAGNTPTSAAGTAEAGAPMISLAEMSRLSIEELSRLLEQGTAALATPQPDSAADGGGDSPAPNVATVAAATGNVIATQLQPGSIAEAARVHVVATEEVFTVAEAERVLHTIQRLEPPGIGARDLRECLMVQLEVLASPEPDYALAYRLLRDAYAEFTMKHFEKIVHKLGCSTDELRDAIEVIRMLNPKPGLGSSATAGTNYVTPDFVIERDGDDLMIISNDRSLPALRINRAYQEMIRRGEGKRRDIDRDTRKFIREKFEAAKWFIASIHQRRQTMLKVMRAIADMQADFFTNGPSQIRPMIYKDVAERIGMDISTVCRVVNGKYAQTEFGTFELRYFFSDKLETASGEEVSTKVVKARIQELIDAEDKQRPLSDDALMHELEKEGFQVARRTVAKYREQLNIPVARLRRTL